MIQKTITAKIMLPLIIVLTSTAVARSEPVSIVVTKPEGNRVVAACSELINIRVGSVLTKELLDEINAKCTDKPAVPQRILAPNPAPPPLSGQ